MTNPKPNPRVQVKVFPPQIQQAMVEGAIALDDLYGRKHRLEEHLEVLGDDEAYDDVRVAMLAELDQIEANLVVLKKAFESMPSVTLSEADRVKPPVFSDPTVPKRFPEGGDA